MDEHRPVRLLSLDGGGIRGVSSILVLKEMMRQVNIDRKPKDYLQPWQVFDLIGGTSTGGIIAIMLGCLKMSVDECYDVYMNLAKTIFKPKRWRCDIFNRGLDLVSASERYDSAKMEDLVQQIIKERTGSRNAMLQDPLRKSPCKVFVTTVRADDEELLLLRSYHNKQQPDMHSALFEMWEALRATSAASTYFKEFRRGNEGYVDGAFKSNNPIFEVHHEACDLWPDRDAFLVSIGTGTKPSAPLGGHVVKLVRSMTKLATATEGSWIRFHRTHKKLAEDNRLFRFSAPGVGEVDLGNHRMIGSVVMRTETYLRETTTARDVATCSREMLRIQTREYTMIHKLSKDEQDCLKLLSSAGGGYESQRLSVEKPVKGTCQWFIRHKAFISWLEEASSTLLWVTANPGCGKTVLSGFLIDVLSKPPIDSTVCHFFFKAGEEGRRHSHQALSAILHQVFKSHPKAISVAMKTYSSTDTAQFTQNIEALWEILCQASDSLPSKKIICIIDALDECGEESRNRFIDLLVKTFPQMMGSRKLLGRLKIIVTSRPWPSIESRFRYLSCVRLRGENEASALSNDVETMVKAKVEKLKMEGTISPEACDLLETTLAKGADRTFLWASLVLETIFRLPSRKLSAVKKALEGIPASLDQLYETALSSIEDRPASTRMLQIILAATRPLTLDEINMAMSINSEHRSVENLLADTEPSVEYTVKRLGGFFVRIMNSTVQLVHQTARDFLLRTAGSGTECSFELARCHAILAGSAVTFLLLNGWPVRTEIPTNLSDLKPFNSKLLGSFPPTAANFYMYAAKNWAYHAQRQGDRLESDERLRQQIASLCTTSCPGFPSWWYVLAEEEYTNRSASRVVSFRFLKNYPLHFAAGQGYFAVMRGLVDSESCSITSRDEKDMDCLVAATRADRTRAIKWLLANFDNSVFQLGMALLLAVRFKSDESVRLLADTEVDLQQKYQIPWESIHPPCSILEAAIYDTDRLAMMLNMGAGSVEDASVTAAEGGQDSALRLLLDFDDHRGEEERNRIRQAALKAASNRGQGSTRRLLMGVGVAEPEGVDLSAGLKKAVMLGCSADNIEMLVEDGARDGSGEALLSRAVFGEVDGVKTLISLLRYPVELMDKALLSFFETYLGAEMGEYLLKTVERVLSSGSRRLWDGFPVKPAMGLSRTTNEAFLTLLSAQNARLPTRRFHQALCYAIAVDEELAIFLLKTCDTLQDHTDELGSDEHLALACLWGRDAVIRHLCGRKGDQERHEEIAEIHMRAVAVSGSAAALGVLRHVCFNTRHVEAQDIGQEFASQWSVVERVMGTSCVGSPLDLAARLGHQDVMAQLLAMERKGSRCR
ncbi:ankyrin repeat protein [Colletotrichum plurivorum]|uniref:Ankyrin repeat protein n=1 Tax=Colletotrichum plurivorum TaxID=2175906 RepID=A0A8H6N969_9PEZI|nr:ankyrin repeat protein [Colletotrichum plurivorum]